MTHLQMGDYVRHADLTLDQYLTFTYQAKAAGFDLSLGRPKHRYISWEYTVLTPTYKQAGTDNKGVCSSAQRDVTRRFTAAPQKLVGWANVDSTVRDTLIAQGWVSPAATPKEQWLADALECASDYEAYTCPTFAEAIYDAMKSGRLSTP